MITPLNLNSRLLYRPIPVFALTTLIAVVIVSRRWLYSILQTSLAEYRRITTHSYQLIQTGDIVILAILTLNSLFNALSNRWVSGLTALYIAHKIWIHRNLALRISKQWEEVEKLKKSWDFQFHDLDNVVSDLKIKLEKLSQEDAETQALENLLEQKTNKVKHQIEQALTRINQFEELDQQDVLSDRFSHFEENNLERIKNLESILDTLENLPQNEIPLQITPHSSAEDLSRSLNDLSEPDSQIENNLETIKNEFLTLQKESL